MKIDKNMICFCVGNITEKKARALGFQNTLAAEGNVSNLKEIIIQICDPQNGNLLYISGELVSYDLDKELKIEGYSVKRIINYSVSPNEKLSDEFVGFKNSKLKDDDSPGKMPLTAFSALIIPIEVLLIFEIEIELSHLEIAVKGISLKSLTETVSGTTIFNSASIDLNAARLISPDGDPSTLVCAPQSLLVYKSKVSSPLPSLTILTG